MAATMLPLYRLLPHLTGASDVLDPRLAHRSKAFLLDQVRPMSTSVRSSRVGRAQKSDFEIARRLRGLLKDAIALALSLNSPDQVAETDCEALLRALQTNEPARELRSIAHNGGRIQGSSSTSGEYERQQHESSQIGALKVVSAREQEVLQLIGYGLSNKEIAQRLGIGPETVKTHIKRIFVKLKIEKRAQAVASLKVSDCLSRNQRSRHPAYKERIFPPRGQPSSLRKPFADRRSAVSKPSVKRP